MKGAIMVYLGIHSVVRVAHRVSSSAFPYLTLTITHGSNGQEFELTLFFDSADALNSVIDQLGTIQHG